MTSTTGGQFCVGVVETMPFLISAALGVF
jgi:hypothetical protein